MSAIEVNYTAPPTVSKFMRSDAFHRAIMGPIGSGKSVGCEMECFRRNLEMPAWNKGMRSSRWAFIRNTNKQLRDTTLATWMQWFRDFGTWKESKMTFHLKFGEVDSEIMFLPLDTPDDVGRVLSLELTGAFVNEFREIPIPMLADIKGRLRRYPNPSIVPDCWYGLISDTNPPEYDSEAYKLMEHLPQEEGNDNSIILCDTFSQPSGLLGQGENLDHLHPQYYSDLAKGQTKAWVDTYIHGKYSPSQAGRPVYANSFVREKHISPVPLDIHPTLPIIIGFDTGLTPALSFSQLVDGKLRILREIAAFDMGMKRCIQTYVRPLVRNEFPDNALIFIGDPAAVRRGDGDESSALKELKKAFCDDERNIFKTAYTNNPDVRIQATEQMLIQFPMGEPMYLIDPSCKRTIRGLQSMYRYQRVKSHGGYADKPQKTGEPGDFGHLIEAGQYRDLYILGGKYNERDFLRPQNHDPMGFFGNTQTGYRPAQAEGY